MSFELVSIDNYEDTGYRNCVDISVDNDNHCFVLGNGLISHNSAMGGLLPSLGRDGKAYYMLKGKPLNAYSSTQQKFLANKELSSLYQIIKNGTEIVDKADGDEWYRINMDGNSFIVNINDDIKINNNWISVRDILRNI